jgi:hypothetical protein
MQVAAGVVLAFSAIGLFNATVSKYEFEKRCHLIESIDSFDRTCKNNAWFSFK